VTVQVMRISYGEAAATRLAGLVRELKAGDPLAPVTVVLPGNQAAVATRRGLARRGGIAGVQVLTLQRLAEAIAGPGLVGAGRRPVAPPVVVQAVRAVLAAEPGLFAPVAGHPATELALAAAQRELAGLSGAGLEAVAHESPRAADVVRIVRRVTEALAGSWYDEHDLLAAAGEALRHDPGCWPGHVVLHLPERVPPGGDRLLASLAGRGRLTVVVGASGVEEADRPVVVALARAGIEVPLAPGVARPRAVRVVSASDPDDEVRLAVRQLVEAAREGVPLGRMAVLFGAVDPYARILREQLEAAGLAANGTPVRTVGEMVAGRVLRGLLGLPGRRFRRGDVIAVLSSAGVVGDGGRPVPTPAWDRVSRAAGVVDGDDWDERLALFAEERVARAGSAEDDERAGLARLLRREAQRAATLASFVARLRRDLAAGEQAGSWAGAAAWATDLLDRYVGHDRGDWPRAEREAAERVQAAIGALAALDEVAGPPPTVETFRRFLDAELDVVLPRLGRMGEGVLVGPVSVAVGLDVDRVVVVGLAEGTFPDRRLDDPLLPDRERAAAGGELPLRADHVDDDHRHLLAALAAGPATVCFPRGDLRRPGERSASRWLLDDATVLAGSASRLGTGDLATVAGAGWLDVVPSFAAGVAGASFPATAQEHRLGQLLRGSGPLSSRAVVAGEPVLAAGAALVEGRRSDLFTRYDGNLAGVDLGAVAAPDRASSATRLQAWAACPHGFLLEHVLGVEVVDEPERRLRIDALDRGALIHRVLHRYVAEGAGSPAELRSIADQVCEEYAARGRTGRRVLWERDRARIVRDLERFFSEDLAWRTAAGAEPVAAEQPFDTVVDLPGGGHLRVRGAIDRVDRLPDGRVVVLDYKTGRSDAYQRLGPDDPHLGASRLQPALYAAGARSLLGERPVRFDYWFVTSAGRFERIGYDVTEKVADRVGQALGVVAAGIRGGIFPRRPPEVPAWGRVDCWYCTPDGLSGADARRDWERKRHDPALADYAELCEPEAGS
jgi:hypothetical protein